MRSSPAKQWKKSKKLLCSQVKIGSEVKQIVSGIKAHYSPEEMVGKKVMVLVNLKPAKLAGVLSEGMILCAEDENGELALMVPEKKSARRRRNLLNHVTVPSLAGGRKPPSPGLSFKEEERTWRICGKMQRPAFWRLQCFPVEDRSFMQRQPEHRR